MCVVEKEIYGRLKIKAVCDADTSGAAPWEHSGRESRRAKLFILAAVGGEGTAAEPPRAKLPSAARARAIVLTLEHSSQLFEHCFVLTPEANLVLERSNTCLKVGVRTLFKRC